MAKVKQIFIAKTCGGELLARTQVTAIAGRGLDGDRYCAEEENDNINAITLIAAEAAEICRERVGEAFAVSLFRRNLIVEGIDVNELLGKQFTIGSAVFATVELCHPCRYLADLLHADVLIGLHNCGGIRARIVASGTVKIGDEIRVI